MIIEGGKRRVQESIENKGEFPYRLQPIVNPYAEKFYRNLIRFIRMGLHQKLFFLIFIAP
jgi:hypothetical protein